MATWMIEGSPLSALLERAMELDPAVSWALALKGDSPDDLGEFGHYLIDLMADQGPNRPRHQLLEDDGRYLKWTVKGRVRSCEGRPIYGEYDDSFSLHLQRKDIRWSTSATVIPGYHLTLVVPRERGTREMKARASQLGWQLVSG